MENETSLVCPNCQAQLAFVPSLEVVSVPPAPTTTPVGQASPAPAADPAAPTSAPAGDAGSGTAASAAPADTTTAPPTM